MNSYATLFDVDFFSSCDKTRTRAKEYILKDPNAIQNLLWFVEMGRFGHDRARAADLLRVIGDNVVAPDLLKQLHFEFDSGAKWHLMRAIGELGDYSSARNILTKIAHNDKVSHNRTMAFKVLDKLKANDD